MSENLRDLRKELNDLERKLIALKKASPKKVKEIKDKIDRLKEKAYNLEFYQKSKLSRIEKLKIARDIRRPTALEIINLLCDDFIELKGDRLYRDDPAIVGGIAEIDGNYFTIIGLQKGSNLKENMARNFGMAHPEGYRKALRLMKQAEKFKRPIITLIDTPGAYPGIGAEERGQAEAIARNLFEMAGIKSIILTFVFGEGGSGGALALSVSDKIFMFENAMYSVISPEGCASILWKDASLANKALDALKSMADDLLNFGIIDGIVYEPEGGFQNEPKYSIEQMKKYINNSIEELRKYDFENLIELRYNKFRKIGIFKEE